MKYILLGSLDASKLDKHEHRLDVAKAKLKELGITLESVYYTQGKYDFVDVVDAPDARAMLTFSIWYARQGYGKVQSLPAFDEGEFGKALAKG